MNPIKEILALDKNRPLNLVLSAGGVKGVAHIALIELLVNEGYTISHISGSSVGALIGALYCSGFPANQLMDFFRDNSLFKYSWIRPVRGGVFETTKYKELVKKYLPNEFENLQIPLTLVTTNMEAGHSCYFETGDLINPLVASCAVPGVFSPVVLNGELHSDGAILDHFPIKPFENSDFPIIGSYLGQPEKKEKSELNTIMKVSRRTNTLLVNLANQHKINSTTTTIRFPLDGYNGFQSKKAEEIYMASKSFIKSLTE